MRYGHLLTTPVTLRTLAPVFIGSGEGLHKKEYIFDGPRNRIYFLDFVRLVDFMKSRGLLSRYEQFLLQPAQKDFKLFLTQNNIQEKDYHTFVSYGIDAGEAARVDNFREVLTFNKDCEGYPYIPGSSLKGAVRTALAAWFLKQGNWQRERKDIETAEVPRQPRYYLANESSRIERKIFYRLDIRNREDRTVPGPVNDFMQAVRISDSAALSFDTLTLVGKYDRKPDGSITPLPIFRECLIPGTEAKFQMTLEMPMLEKVGLDMERMETALHDFADAHYENFEQYFSPELPNDAEISAREGVDIILGGGAGYASKTITYNLYPRREQALPLIAKIMDKQFPRHGHQHDAARHRVSPHILKTALYKDEFYQMGRCELILK